MSLHLYPSLSLFAIERKIERQPNKIKNKEKKKRREPRGNGSNNYNYNSSSA